MATSTEKVAEAIDTVAGQLLEQLPAMQRNASGLQAVALAAAGPFIPQLIPQLLATIHASLPADPGQLDGLLDQAAGYIATLKTDPAPAALEATP